MLAPSLTLAARPLAGIAACALVCLTAVSAAGADEFTGPIAAPIPGAPNAELTAPAGRYAGWSVDGAGDVNGDGHDDVIVGAPGTGAAGPHAGGAYVLFGPVTTTSVSLETPGAPGFRIEGASGYFPELGIDGSYAGVSVSGAGDVNADGLDDVIVGAPGWASNPGDPPGSAYVVFGKTTSDTVDLASLGSQGFEIAGAPAGRRDTAYWVDGAGDVNGDGRDDVAVATRFGGPAYVVFGKAQADTVHLDELGAAGFTVLLPPVHEHLHLVGAGDVNGDGRDDLVASTNRQVFVVFGRVSHDPVDLTALGSGGFSITGTSFGVGTWPIAGATAGGDVNGDGRDDVLVGNPQTTFNGSAAGSVWVVFGKSSTGAVDLNALGTGGYRIDGAAKDMAGGSIAGAGDLNGDGRGDVLIGGCVSYVVLGQSSTAKVNLGQLGGRGFKMKWCVDRAGQAALAGNLVGNSRDDLLLGGLGNRAYLVEAPAILGLSTTSGPPTTVLQVSGSFFDVAEPVDLFFDGVFQRRVLADAAGNFSGARATVPGSALPGVHRFRAVGATSGRAVERPFLVRTNWTHQGYGATRTGYNPYENVLGRSTVAGLQPAWTGSVTGPFAGAPVVAAGNVHLASRAGVVSTLDPTTGALLWSTSTGAAIAAGPMAANSTVYVGGADGKVHALDKRFGRPRWVKQLPAATDGSLAASQSVVYVHANDGYVYALDANVGTERWSAYVGPNTGGASPAVSNSAVYLVSGTDVVALAPATGARLWTRSLADGLTTPVVSSSVVYVGSGATATVHAISATTGALRWTRALAEATPASVGSLVVGEGVVYAQTASALHALNAADGVPRFTRTDAGAVAPGQTFALANHVLYLPGPRALNGSTGALLWSGGTGADSPAVADGVLYAGARAYRLP